MAQGAVIQENGINAGNMVNTAISMDSFFHLKENCLSVEDCKHIMEKYAGIRSYSKKNKRVVENAEKIIKEVLLDDFKSEWNEEISKIRDSINAEVSKYLHKFKTVNTGNFRFGPVALWEQAESEYSPLHYDKEWVREKTGEDEYRSFLCLLYLNQNYEGGEVIFPLQGKVIKPKTGMLLIFPTSLYFPHQTTPVIGSDRFLLRASYYFDKTTLN